MRYLSVPFKLAMLVLVVPLFWLWRAALTARSLLVPALFRMMEGRAGLYVAAMPVLLPVYGIQRLGAKLCDLFAKTWTDYALRHYHAFVRVHYGHTGDRYREFDTLALEHWKEEIAAITPSRLLPFHQFRPDLTGFCDGDSFLELGCGGGNELWHLAHAFPTSKISGIDFNPYAAAMLNGEAAGRISTSSGDLGDLEVLRRIPDASHDHVLFIHSDHYLFAHGYAETEEYRRKLFAESLRIAAKGVVLVRETLSVHCPLRFEMARDLAGVIRDDLATTLAAAGAEDIIACFREPNILVTARKAPRKQHP